MAAVVLAREHVVTYTVKHCGHYPVSFRLFKLVVIGELLYL